MGKAMRFEKFLEDPFLPAGWRDHEYWIRLGWDAARIGTISAENAVVIPEWPNDKDIVGVVIGWDCNGPGCHLEEEGKDYYKLIKYIPRPKPVWVPQVGDKIFFQVDSVVGDVIAVGTISHISVEGYCAVNGRKETHWKKCKPFHQSHIGKPWSEIPGEPL